MAKKMAAKQKSPKFVIGLGASAGGLDALEQFLDHAPIDSGAAFVVVMHLSRDFKSMLDELLARHTDMQVKPAKDGEELRPNTVYIIQPKTYIEIGANQLKVETRPDVDPEGVATSVDVLFKSIAKNWGKRGAGVVLSGSGSDGAKGIRAIRDAGGFTCAQSPETAKFDPMPIAAINTESVNAVESPDHLGRTVIDGLLMPMVAPAPPIANDHDQAMSTILDAVIGSSSIKANEYKHSTFERRVSRRMMALRFNDLAEYATKVAEDPVEAQKLSQELLIGVTDFFRDSSPYKVITRQIIPQIIKEAHEEKRPVRVWVAGCATGEEVYSMAILFREALRDMPFEIDVQIFATDISKKHLTEATRGIYSPERVESIPASLLERYFEQDTETGNWTVIKRLRKMIVFAPHDLLSDPPFTKLDLVCCRNVLIYFSIEAQQRILGGFAFGLRTGGFLFLGSSETVGGQRDVFDFVDARNRVFRRTQSFSPAIALSKARDLFPLQAGVGKSSKRNPRSRVTELQPAYSALLARFAPPSLLISDERELLHSFGDASKYLRVPDGVAQFDVAELIDPALKTPLIAAIERSGREEGAMTFSRITLESAPQAGCVVDLTLQPLPPEEEGADRHLLVIIDEKEERPGDSPEVIQTMEADRFIAGRNDDLELELSRTREALQSTIEENETANEELQASNEELMSANEELQSTNEELSSVNEELYSVNAEYHRQNDDLSRLTNDFDLLLNATQIGVLFLDDSVNITRFTGLAKKLFGLEENDIGRPVANFSSPFADFSFDAILTDVPRFGAVVEHETVDRNGNPWLIRIVSDNANFGVVIAFIDIGELRGAEGELREMHSNLKAIQKVGNAFIVICDAKFETIYSQVGFDKFVGLEELETPSKFSYNNVHEDDLERLRAHQSALSKDAKRTSLTYRMFCAPQGDYIYIHATAQKLDDGNWQVVGKDVDESHQALAQLQEQKAILEAILWVVRSYTAFVDSEGIFRFANDAFCELLDKEASEVIGLGLIEVLPPNLYAQAKSNIEAVMEGKDREGTNEVLLNGERIMLESKYHPVVEDGKVIGFVYDGINVSDLANYAEKFANSDRLITASTRRSFSPFMIVDQMDGRIVFANPTAEGMLGLNSGEFAEGKFSISRLTPECGEERWLEYLSQLGPKQEMTLDDMIIFGRNKKTAVADIYLEFDPTNSEQSLVTVRVVRNEAKQKMIIDLRERSRLLASSNRDLELFTTAVAHDLRAPLRHITSFSDILGKGSEDLSSDEIRNHSEIIASSARNLSNMVGGLLDYARIGLREISMEQCDLELVIERAKENLSSEIASSGAIISLTGQGEMLGNFDLLVSLFQNLISNSIKYVAKGVNPEIKIDISAGHKKTVISVSDNGIGVDADFAEKIFGLFHRLHADGEYSGLGLGLSTCRKIAEMHNAQIDLDNDYTIGSRFVVQATSLEN